MQETDVILPVVGSLEEAAQWATDFESILTVGPQKREVNWGHGNHMVFTFGDSTGGNNAPKLSDIEKAVMWGAEQDDLLVHCHAGMSRSTSTAWGISIMRGADPLDSFIALKNAQPIDTFLGHNSQRDFIPNPLIVKHLEKILNISYLSDIRREHSTVGGWL